MTVVDRQLIERIWAVDVEGQIVLILFHDDNPPWEELTPERLAVAQDFVDSIQIRVVVPPALGDETRRVRVGPSFAPAARYPVRWPG